MKFFNKFALSAAFLPLAFGASLAAAAPVAPASASPAIVDADPALWVVKDDDTTIYLFGTIHALKPGLGWFDEAIKDAFDKSDQLMLEVVLPEDQNEMVKTMIPMAIDQSGKGLPSRLSADELKAYQAAMTGLGIPANQFDMFEPWLPAMTLAVLPLTKLGYDPEQGAEKQLTRQAKAAGKPVAGLESLTEQLGFFDKMPETVQVAFLNAAVRELDNMGPQLDKMVALWAKGDPQTLGTLMNDSMKDTPEVADILLNQRNARWADTLKARMDQPGTVFVAVGAGHLAGDKSVQNLLQQRGLTVTRISY